MDVTLVVEYAAVNPVRNWCCNLKLKTNQTVKNNCNSFPLPLHYFHTH